MRYIIAGYGKFGRIAHQRLRDAFPDARIVVVEKNPRKGPVPTGSTVTVFTGDAVSFLTDSPFPDEADIIIPMIPIHLAAHYVRALNPGTTFADLDDRVARQTPNPLMLDASTLCCSYADFLCPDDCPEGENCTVTGRPRDVPLYKRLSSITVQGTDILVLRSRQILPGVGGYPLHELKRPADSLAPGRHMIATSCKCHGIITALEHPTSGDR